MPIDLMYGDLPEEEPQPVSRFVKELKLRLQHAYDHVRSEMGARS